MKTDDLNAVTAEAWEASRYVEVSLQPQDKWDTSPRKIIVEYRGATPYRATYSAFGHEDYVNEIKNNMASSHPDMIVGDGKESNARMATNSKYMSKEIGGAVMVKEYDRAQAAERHYNGGDQTETIVPPKAKRKSIFSFLFN